MDPSLLYLNGKELKDDFEKFMYHAEFSFVYLQSIVDDWTPQEEFGNWEGVKESFLEYYTQNTKQPFPDEFLAALELFLDYKNIRLHR